MCAYLKNQSMFKSATLVNNLMKAISTVSSERIGDGDIVTLVKEALVSEQPSAPFKREAKNDQSSNMPGSIEFHYRNHPNLLRMTRQRANRHGGHVSAAPAYGVVEMACVYRPPEKNQGYANA